MRIILSFLLALIISACEDTGCKSFDGSSLNNASVTVQLDGKEYDSGVDVVEGNLFRVRIFDQGVYEKPLKYRAIVRVDPRFKNATTYLFKYNISQDNYSKMWGDGRGTDIISELNYLQRNSKAGIIPMNAGEVASIRMLSLSEFYDGKVPSFLDLDQYTKSVGDFLLSSGANLDNVIIDTYDKTNLCNYNNALCADNKAFMIGLIEGFSQFAGLEQIVDCDKFDLTKLCKFNKGVGLGIYLGSDMVKDPKIKFLPTASGEYVYYVFSNDGEDLQFSYLYNIDNVVSSNNPTYQGLQYTENLIPYLQSKISAAAQAAAQMNQGSATSGNGASNSSSSSNVSTSQRNRQLGVFGFRGSNSNNNNNGSSGDGSINSANNSSSSTSGEFVNNTDILGNATPSTSGSLGDNSSSDGGEANNSGNQQIGSIAQTNSSGSIGGSGTTNISSSASVNNNTGNQQQPSPGSNSPAINPSNIIEQNFMNDVVSNFSFKRFVAGRYLLEIEVGSGGGKTIQEKKNSIQRYYTIKQGRETIYSGQVTGDYLEINAPKSGRVFYSVNQQKNGLQGGIIFNTQSYTKSSGFSNFLNDNILQPLKEQMLFYAKLMFGILSTNSDFSFFLRGVLTLYILFFGFNFALGSVDITVKELGSRIMKVMIVGMLFSNQSWEFFNLYLFGLFLEGTDQLMKSVSDATAVVGNPFSFIDPIISKYLDSNLWFVIWNYIAFFFWGYILPALLLILGIYYFMISILEVMLGFLMAYLSLCVVIALAPIFITCILFEKTRSIFDNWVNIMFSYTIQPVLALMFLLIIDQIASTILEKGIIPVCYSCLWEWRFIIDAFGINIPLFCIYGYEPTPFEGNITNLYRLSILFYCLMKLMRSVVTMSVNMADMLTGGGAGGSGAASGSGTQEMASGIMQLARYPIETYGRKRLERAGKIVSSYVGNAIKNRLNKEDKKDDPNKDKSDKNDTDKNGKEDKVLGKGDENQNPDNNKSSTGGDDSPVTDTSTENSNSTNRVLDDDEDKNKNT